MNKHLHIICWDVPFPADYGGVIDVFYTIKNLHQLGVKIIFHCFYYGNRNIANELNQYCEEVFYYPRINGLKGLDTTLPYIVSSRRNQILLNNLVKDDYPILFEGIHCTFYINHALLLNRKKYVRTHNVEHHYYEQLGKNSNFGFKKLYYYWEAIRLKNYEHKLPFINGFIEIAKHDWGYFEKVYPNTKHLFLPGFQSFDQVESKIGVGDYCLYHGNLSVIENHFSAMFLIQKVFSKLKIQLIIAGKNPKQELLKLENSQIKIVANPSDEKLNDLISNAHINVLPSFQSTGMKLKLLHALFIGRFCITNKEMMIGTELESAVIAAKNEIEFAHQIKATMNQQFTQVDISRREKALSNFSNQENAKKLIDFIIAD